MAESRSPNPAGRPKGSKNKVSNSSILRETMREFLTEDDNKRLKSILNMLYDRVQNDQCTNSAELLLNRFAGRPSTEQPEQGAIDVNINFSPPPMGDEEGLDDSLC